MSGLFDSHLNFAYGTVATAPSPATSGTSLVLATGQGALFPAAPFNAVIWPTGVSALSTNAEVVRVTAKSTDTLTIVRAQESSTARSVIATDQIAAAITAKTITDLENAIPYFYPGAYGTFGTGATGTQNTAAIQGAIDAASAAGGGVVFIPQGLYTIRQIVVKDRVSLRGAGHLATRLFLEAGQNKHAVINYVSSNGTTDPNALYYEVMDLCIDGNKANNTSGNGIYFSRNPEFTPATNDAGGDSDLQWENQATVENVLLLRCKDDGYESTGIGDHRLVNVMAEHCDGNGFTPAYDAQLSNCLASNSGLAGFNLAGPNAHLGTCKAYYSGKVDDTKPGFSITGKHVQLAACEAQDNWGPGVQMDGTYGCVIHGKFESNSKAGVGAFPGVDLWNSHYNVISFSGGERRADGTNSGQQNSVQLRSGCVGNQINLTHWCETWVPATIGTAIQGGSTAISGNTIIVNNQLGAQNIAYAATITPDPYAGGKVIVGTLTGNITVNAPSNAHIGCRLSFKFTQDATGGRTITLNSTFKKSWTPTTTANKINTIEFEYDGTNWIQVGGTVGI